MAQTFNSMLANGGGRIEWAFFIHGLPWLVCSHADVITALSNPGAVAAQRTYRGWLCGNGSTTVNGEDTYFADDIPIIDSLDPAIGNQAIKFDEGKQLQGGSWSVNIFSEPQAPTYVHRSGTILGLEGLDVIPNSDYDSSICEARLSRDLEQGGSELFFKDDTGEKLEDKLAANFAAKVPTYIYIGTEVVAAYSVATDEGGGEFHCDITRGAWKTVQQRHQTEDYESNNAPVSDAPTLGIAGRPAVLYAIPMAADGTILDITAEPVRFREGPCMPSSSETQGLRKVSVGFKTKWLDHDIKANYAEAHLRGFLFSRQSGATDQSPHMVLREWSGAGFVSFDIWLCAAGETVFFETHQEACDAAHLLILAEATAQEYVMDYSKGPVVQDAVILSTEYPRMGGPLPEIMGWGAVKTTQLQDHRDNLLSPNPVWTTESGTLDGLYGSEILRLWLYDSADVTQGAFPLYIQYALAGRAKYFHQFGWNVDPAAEYEYPATPWRCWQPPKDTGDASYRLYLSLDDDATVFVNQSELTIGVQGNLVDDELMMGKFVVEATDGTDNYIDLENASPGYNLGVMVDGETTYPTVSTLNEEQGFFRWGTNIMHHPAAHGKDDPWVVRDRVAVAAGNPVDLLRGILGIGDYAPPPQYRIYHIPDIADDVTDTHSNWHEGWDWDKLTELVESSDATGSSANIAFNDSLNYADLYYGLLSFHGISEVYEFSDAIAGFRISYRRQGVVNQTAAALQGRVIDASVRVGNDAPVNVTANTWLYDRIDARFNYDDTDEKYKVTLTAEDHSGRALGASKTLKIKDRLTYFEELDDDTLEDLRQHFGAQLKRLTVAAPEQKVRCNILALSRLAVGREALVTDPSAKLPYTGELGLVKQPVLVTALDMYVSNGAAGVNATYRFAPNAVRGWAPSVYLDAAEISSAAKTVTIAMADALPADQNDFADPNGGLTDLQGFDCWRYNASTDTATLDSGCGCSNYAVQIFDADVTTYDQANPGRNHWTGTITVTTSDDAVLELSNADNFNDATDKIMIFDEYDNCETCQQDYLFLADSGGEVGAADKVGGKWI